jgi:transposase-like protein
VTRYRFVAQYQPQYGVRRCCRAVGVSPSGFYDWHRRLHQPSARSRGDQALTAQITRIHRQSGGAYGAPVFMPSCRSPAGSGSAASGSPG